MDVRTLLRSAGVLLLAGLPLSAAPVLAPLDVRKTDQSKLDGQVAVARAGEQVKISFTVTTASDVEVAVLDARGRTIRHVAAGLLGPNAPAPLTKDSLAQELTWDGRDDAGQAAAGGPFKVRVRVGSQAKLEKYLGHDPMTLAGDIDAITVGADGELYVLVDEGFKFGRSELLVLDRNGKYLRTIMPYSADTPAQRTESVGHLMIEGQRVPILFSGHSFSVYPLVCGLRGQSMAWHPKGYLIAASSTGTAREHGPPRYLLAFDRRGGAPEGVPFVGPKILDARGFLGGGGERAAVGMDRLAVSPDGLTVYLNPCVGNAKGLEAFRKHGIYRLKWSDAKIGPLWLGKDAPGQADGEFNDPQGLAADREGRVYVCDRGNNRVQVFDAEGKFLGKFEAPSPEQIGVHASGQIFVLSRMADKSAPSRLLAFGAWKDGTAARLADVESPGVKFLALDPAAEPVRLWAVVRDKGQCLTPVAYADGKFTLGAPILGGAGLVNPSFLAADPERGRVIVKEHRTLRMRQPFRSIDLDSGKMTSLDLTGSDITLDGKGNIYCTDGYAETYIARYDPSGKPLPFAGSESNRIPVQFRSYGPDQGLRGHRVAPDGDLFIIRSVNHGVGATLDQYGPDGKLKKAGLVAGIGGGDSGLGVDAAGNLYVGLNLRPADRPFPAEFAGVMPADNWLWWRKKQMPPPWGYIYINPYLFHMGAVFKFGPAGGVIYGEQLAKKKTDQITSPGSELTNAPADAVAYKSAYLQYDVKVAGSMWSYGGIGTIPASIDGPTPDPGCKCMPSHLDADLYGRVFAPDPFLFDVQMIDSAGNRIARIGQYGNSDDAGPAIRFSGPEACDFAEADGRLYVSDIANRRVVVIRFDWSDAAEKAVP
ncbi:MAG: hypothetical protein BIFFINMI_00177 [Phycisphaerae bacterium]|nr:hypothetical protein [Phycisphaerae bacterium]